MQWRRGKGKWITTERVEKTPTETLINAKLIVLQRNPNKTQIVFFFTEEKNVVPQMRRVRQRDLRDKRALR